MTEKKEIKRVTLDKEVWEEVNVSFKFLEILEFK